VTDGAEDWLQAGCRVIRRVAGEGEVPWPGALVAIPGGGTALAVDAAVLGAGWAGWKADPDGHVVAPMDVLRRADGHDAVLPVCTERLDTFLARRGSGSDLAIGEAVTIAVSLLRGIAELSSDEQDPDGSWWLTDAGRPILAGGTGQRAVAETVLHLEALSAALPNAAEVLGEAAAVVADPRRRLRESERTEAAIFELAEPLELATTSFGPKRVRRRASPQEGAPAQTIEPEAASWAISLSRHLDADWADLVSRTTTSVWRALRAPGEGRRRPWLIAAGLAGVVLTGGLMWPTGGTGPATADVPVGATPAAAPGSEPSTTPPASTPMGASASDADLAVVAAELLAQRTECDDSACLAGVLESPGVELPAGVIDVPAEVRVLTLLDEFGGAAVLRVESTRGDAAPQLVVIVRADGRWLLRDVYDVPQQ
jgi:hypothetical protein